MHHPETEKDFLWQPPYCRTIDLPRAVVGRDLSPILRRQLSHLLHAYHPDATEPKDDDLIVYAFTITESAFMRQYLCGRPLALAVREVLYADKAYGRVRIAVSCWRRRAMFFGHAWRPVPLNDDNLTIRMMCDNFRDLICPPIRWAQTRDE